MLTSYEIILRLLLGTLLGGIIGFERQTHGRPAGFRTQLLVCVACVLLMIISENYNAVHQSVTETYLRLDPTRIAAGAMTGIGFLGAGVIVKTGMSVQGLTTAACIWIVAAIGLAVGTGQYLAAVTGSVITFISLWMLRIVETRIPRLTYRYVTLVTDETGDDQAVRSLFTASGFEVSKMDYEISLPEKERRFFFTVASRNVLSLKEIIDKVTALNYVKKLVMKS